MIQSKASDIRNVLHILLKKILPLLAIKQYIYSTKLHFHLRFGAILQGGENDLRKMAASFYFYAEISSSIC